jgi:hypothetical protein
MSVTSNGLYAVMMALAASDDTGAKDQQLQQQQLDTSNLLSAILKYLAKDGGNIQAEEAFIQDYLASHGMGSAARANMTTGDLLALMQLSSMLTKLKNDQNAINQAQQQYNQDQNDYNQASQALSQELQDMGISTGDMSSSNSLYDALYRHFAKKDWEVFILGGLGVGVIASMALAEMVKIGNMGKKVASLQADMNNIENQKIKPAEADAQALLAQSQGGLKSQASQLSSTANNAMKEISSSINEAFLFSEEFGNLVNTKQ